MCSAEYKNHCWNGLECLRCGKKAQRIWEVSRQARKKIKNTTSGVLFNSQNDGKSWRYGKKKLGVVKCLEILGYTNFNKKVSRKAVSFWQKNYDRLPYILKDCSDLYKGLCKTTHPDTGRNSASHESMVACNNAWSRIEKLFAARGVIL